MKALLKAILVELLTIVRVLKEIEYSVRTKK